MQRFFWVVATGLLMCAWMASSVAENAGQDVTAENINGLKSQVQELKRNVLEISTRLLQIEEKQNASPASQVSIFLAVDQKNFIHLELIKIKIDGVEAANHIYTINELKALQRGGVQRLYTGNIRDGEHVLEMACIGKSTGGKDFQQSTEYKFSKESRAKFIEIMLAGHDSGNPDISFRD